MAFERDGSGLEPLSSRHDDLSPTLFCTFVDGFLNGFLVFLRLGVGLGPRLGDDDVVIAEFWQLDALLNLLAD